MKCDNCTEDATHKHEPSGVSAAFYCALHLPQHLLEIAEQLVVKKSATSTKASQPADANPEA
jgi:hypothetical protein